MTTAVRRARPDTLGCEHRLTCLVLDKRQLLRTVGDRTHKVCLTSYGISHADNSEKQPPTVHSVLRATIRLAAGLNWNPGARKLSSIDGSMMLLQPQDKVHATNQRWNSEDELTMMARVGVQQCELPTICRVVC
jgi:hypothetical protein